jgi:hypothetical protein
LEMVTLWLCIICVLGTTDYNIPSTDNRALP